MATITGFTAAKMLEIENATIVDAEVRPDGHLWLIQHDGNDIDAGSVQGPAGPVGPQGPPAVASIPGEVKLWPGDTLPLQATYGKWVWADGAVYVVATYPIAAGHIATQWRTFGGASDPGGSNFRVPDMRGVAPVGMDAMPGGARANRMTRAVAITLAGRAGEETHVVTIAETPSHAHVVNAHSHGGGNHSHPQPSDLEAFSHGYQSGQTGASGGDRSLVLMNGTGPSGVIIAAESPGTNNIGGGGAHENVQPSVFVPYIVRLDG